MFGVIGKVLRVMAHPITAMVVRSLDEAVDFIETWVAAFADKKLSETERIRIVRKLDTLAKSLLGIDK